jgi:nucleoside-diphosphate-sugar epimerase
VVVTGIAGYLGSQVGLALLRDGYHVRGTVRDPNNEKRMKVVRASFAEFSDQITFVKADLLDEDSI